MADTFFMSKLYHSVVATIIKLGTTYKAYVTLMLQYGLGTEM